MYNSLQNAYINIHTYKEYFNENIYKIVQNVYLNNKDGILIEGDKNIDKNPLAGFGDSGPFQSKIETKTQLITKIKLSNEARYI